MERGGQDTGWGSEPHSYQYITDLGDRRKSKRNSFKNDFKTKGLPNGGRQTYFIRDYPYDDQV